MMYTPEMLASMKKVEAAREANIAYEPRRLTAEEKEALLNQYHPDYKNDGFTTIQVGPNKGERAPVELNDMLEDTLEAMGTKATIGDVAFGITLDDGKYDSVELSCVYSVTVAGETYNVTLKMTADYSYDNVAAVTAPADAAQYQEAKFDELFGD